MRLARLLTMAGMGIVALGAMYAAKPAQGAMIVNQYAPDHETSPTTVLFNFDVTNANNGAIIDQLNIYLFNQLPSQLQALPQNQGKTLEEIKSGITFQVRGTPESEVSTGWSRQGTGLDPLVVGHAPFGWAKWYDSFTNPAKDKQAYTLGIEKPFFDGNGNGWSLLDTADYKAVISDMLRQNAVVGKTLDIHNLEIGGSAFEIAIVPVVPEPATLALLGVTPLCYTLMRRRRT